MKRLLLILILTFSFQSWTKADDIRDFEIEGVSIGESLLDKYNKKHRSDKTEKSINYITEFIFKNGDTIVTICEDWSSYMGHADSLRVGIVPKKFYDWINKEAYK